MSRYQKGCDLSKVAKATEVPAIDLKKVLDVDSSNPFLRALRIQQGFLSVEKLPAALRTVAPRRPEEQ
jgi:hypothetical protein